jgi:hypothetical protein
MRRCFPHIGGQTKTPPEPGFTRHCLHLSTALTIEPLSRYKYTLARKGNAYFLAPPLPFPVHAIGDSMFGGHYRTAGQSGSTSRRPGPTAGNRGPVVGPACRGRTTLAGLTAALPGAISRRREGARGGHCASPRALRRRRFPASDSGRYWVGALPGFAPGAARDWVADSNFSAVTSIILATFLPSRTS